MDDNIFSKKDCFSQWQHVPSQLIIGDKTKCQHPLVSIVMPCYKRVEYFRIALESAINQDCDFEYEIVIVDNDADNPNCQIQSIIESLHSDKVFYYRNRENIGMVANWNRGVELARADYISYCHDDDILEKDCLRTLMDIQRKYPGKCILPEYNYIDNNGEYIRKKDYPLHMKKFKFIVERLAYPCSMLDLFYDNLWCGGGCLFKKSNMLALGGYNNAFYPPMDYAFNISYCYYYGAVSCNKALYNYRISPIQASSNSWVNSVAMMDTCRQQMIPKMPYPSAFLNRLRIALFNKFTVQYNSQHDVLKDEDVRAYTSKDKRMIKWCFLYSRSIKPYKLNL